MMKQFFLIFATILASVSFAGEPMPATKLEIAHLFSYLQESGCQFDRNGTWYDSGEAVSHLNKKYQYLMGKGLILSSEDFIEGAASESSISGQAYRVRCGSNPAVNSADWFRAELEKYRKSRSECRQEKRDVKQKSRETSRDIRRN
jgi:hypothetical protein